MNVFGENRAKPAMRGMVWTGAEKVLVQGMGFVQGVILARLLRPHDFGLAAMLGLFLSLGSALAETGLGTAYVVYGGDARRVFAWNVGVGAAIYAVLAASAPWIAGFYGEPALKPLTWIMGAGMVALAACVAGGREALECVERAAGADRPPAAEGSEMDSFPLRAGSVRNLQKLKMALCAPLLQIERDACEVALCGFVEKSGRACHGGSKRRRGRAPSQQG